MRSKASSMIALALLSVLILASFDPIPTHAQASPVVSGYSLSSVQSYNQYGQFRVNETLTGANNSASLNSVTFGFPIAYQPNLAQLSSYAKSGHDTIQTTTTVGVSNDTLLITINLGQSLGGANSTLGLGFWVLNELTPMNASGYFRAPILESPSVNINLNQFYSEIDFPYSTTYVGNFASMGGHGYSQTVSGSTSQIFNYTTSKPNSTLMYFNTVVYSTPSSSGALDFTSIVRHISIDASGNVMVRDTLDVHNYGLNLISLLSYSPLTNVGNLTAVPSNEPPLSNVGLIQISGGQLQLNSTNHAIQPLSSATLIFEYPLSSQYWSVSN
ncbi:MAG: hypothetical protein JRN67_11890, partial [Nitrososphaerota archaeon]|nr:hypothetical protein [Nitrososphaerota archaeon]